MEETENLSLELMTADDWPAVRTIYIEGIVTGDATFETSASGWEAWDAAHLCTCRLVARLCDETIGWAALTPVSGRCVYAGVAEVSIYIAKRMRGRKVGQRLLAALVEKSEEQGIWTLQAGIFPENIASIEAHKRCGFRVVGVREKMGKMNGVWRDVVLMERRSRIL
ncbi:GNAT family N-acetyltransferase [Alloacidobacterium sp.]|uniref:GNAT family N-acetyltransferase n=1 Tax=Alloacidobacterium sp. TaxID=2951999 RepID=UPI002D646B19|nr:GNAT family N-acetyltransferase [Alloacidobacterium sp.]HYK34748.1 GNAT family N-acetyltransferase [Alloacidobacterium sp.]